MRPKRLLRQRRLKKQTLIAMATHGRSGLDRWLLGSVAEKVLRAAANPMLVVRAKEENPTWEMATLKRIIVPLDGSELSERILPYVEGLAKNLDLEVNLIGVYGAPLIAGGTGEGLYSSGQINSFIATTPRRNRDVSRNESRGDETEGFQKSLVFG